MATPPLRSHATESISLAPKCLSGGYPRYARLVYCYGQLSSSGCLNNEEKAESKPTSYIYVSGTNRGSNLARALYSSSTSRKGGSSPYAFVAGSLEGVTRNWRRGRSFQHF